MYIIFHIFFLLNIVCFPPSPNGTCSSVLAGFSFLNSKQFISDNFISNWLMKEVMLSYVKCNKIIWQVNVKASISSLESWNLKAHFVYFHGMLALPTNTFIPFFEWLPEIKVPE